MKIEDMIAAVQTKLGVQADGRAGPETWSAIYARIVGPPATGTAPIPATAATAATAAIDTVDAQSEKNIATLLPQVQPMARALVQKAAQNGIRIKIVSGLRTYAEQDALYAQGRTKPGSKVTNARGGYSNHNFGIAFDIGVFEGNKYLPDSPKYKAVGALGTDLGLAWGGNWKTIVDQPHFELRPSWAADLTESKLLAELRGRVAAGTPVFA
jgi:peptidoglycan LD-endopeptidase CwlK